MLLRARLLPLGEDSRQILERSQSSKSLRPISNRFPVTLDNGKLSKILKEGEAASGFWVSAEAVFAKAELSTITHFEVVCRKFIIETKKDYELNYAACERANLIMAGGKEPIRLGSGFALTRINLKPNMVGAIGDWTEEYVFGSAVKQVFEQSCFTGWTAKSVLNPKTEFPHPDYFHLFSETILNPATIDCSVEFIQSKYPDENGCLRHLGCLSYNEADLAQVSDFARTAEPWGGWHGWPSWIVSSRVANIFNRKKLRGWAFRPVLTTEYKLYQEYLNQWQLLCEAVAECSISKFDGGRW